MALKFFGRGSYQGDVGNANILNVSQPSVSRCLNEVVDAISNHLLNDWITFPTAMEDKAFVKRGCVAVVVFHKLP